MRDFNYVLSLASGFARPVTRIRQTPKVRAPETPRRTPSPGPRQPVPAVQRNR
jgi:hypothetical protein